VAVLLAGDVDVLLDFIGDKHVIKVIIPWEEDGQDGEDDGGMITF
jgi:hypothetical protein